MTGYMRLWNPDWFSSSIPVDEIRKKDVHGKYPTTFEMRYNAAANATPLELGGAANAAFYGSRIEVATNTCIAAASYTSGQSFKIYEANGTGGETVHWVWFKLDAAGPGDPSGGDSGLECTITTGETPTQVAVIVAAAIDGEGGLTATSTGAVVTAESDAVGNVTDLLDVDTGTVCTTTYQGAYQQSCKLWIVSAHADDTDSSDKEVRKVRIIGLSVSSDIAEKNGTEKPIYTVEQINMAGQTPVETVRYYQRVMHIYACDWGSAAPDAAGNITLEDANTGTGNVYLTITATYNESNSGGLIYVGDGYFGRWKRLFANINDAAFDNS